MTTPPPDAEAGLRLNRFADQVSAFGLAISYLMGKPAFQGLPFGHWAQTIAGQIRWPPRPAFQRVSQPTAASDGAAVVHLPFHRAVVVPSRRHLRRNSPGFRPLPTRRLPSLPKS